MSTDISTDLRCVVLAVWPTDKNGYMPMGHEKTPLGNLLVIAEKPHVFETYNDAWFAVCFRE